MTADDLSCLTAAIVWLAIVANVLVWLLGIIISDQPPSPGNKTKKGLNLILLCLSFNGLGSRSFCFPCSQH